MSALGKFNEDTQYPRSDLRRSVDDSDQAITRDGNLVLKMQQADPDTNGGLNYSKPLTWSLDGRSLQD